MAEENISQEFRLKNIDETRNDLIEEINGNKLMSQKPKKVCTALNYIEQFLILGSTITELLEFCNWYKSIIKKKKKKHNKIVLLAQSKLNSIEVLISKVLVDSVISHEEFVVTNNVLKEYKNKMKGNNMKEGKKKGKNKSKI